MRWQGRRQSTNVNDVRGSGGLGGRMGGGLGGMGRGGPFAVRRAGGGGIGAIVVILILAFVFGINPLDLLSGNISPGGAPQSQVSRTGANDEGRAFVATVLADTEDTWSEIFAASGEDYPEPTLTLFSNSVTSACGYASAATGPFYCPRDQNLYIDLGFFEQLQQRFGAPGDFAQAYVIAHEVGHHVQNVLGQLKSGGSGAESDAVRTELQADCYSGVWANHTNQRGLLEAGDVDEALTAAAAVGDDKLQERGQGYVVPDSFTHGTSEQRAKWFHRGFEGGDINHCNTFEGEI